MHDFGKRSAGSVLVLIAIFALVGCSGPRALAGDGTLFRQLDCLGIKFDSGVAYPVSFWPDGYTTHFLPGASPTVVLVDAAEQVVLKEGDRINARISMVDAGGDTRCSSSPVVTVEQFSELSTVPVSPSP